MSSLRNIKVAVDPGHGGKDPGACGPKGLYEKDVALKVALKFRDRLIAEGAKVVMTRDRDIRPAGDDASPRDDLQKRCDIANSFGADVFISIHLNGAGNLAHGFEILYATGSKKGILLAKLIRSRFSEEFPDHANRGAKADSSRYKSGIYVLRHTVCPAVLAELEFITNPVIAEQLVLPEVQERYASVLLRGLQDWVEAFKE